MINKNKKIDFTNLFLTKTTLFTCDRYIEINIFSVLEQYMHLAVQLNNIQICFLHYKDIKGVEDFYL